MVDTDTLEGALKKLCKFSNEHSHKCRRVWNIIAIFMSPSDFSYKTDAVTTILFTRLYHDDAHEKVKEMRELYNNKYVTLKVVKNHSTYWFKDNNGCGDERKVEEMFEKIGKKLALIERKMGNKKDSTFLLSDDMIKVPFQLPVWLNFDQDMYEDTSFSGKYLLVINIVVIFNGDYVPDFCLSIYDGTKMLKETKMGQKSWTGVSQDITHRAIIDMNEDTDLRVYLKKKQYEPSSTLSILKSSYYSLRRIK
jgi:hypothetical protein